MTGVVGEDTVRDVYRRGQRKLVVDPQDIVTAQALDSMSRLGMRLLRAPVASAPPLSTEPGRALSRTLYRRHPGFVPAVRQRSDKAIQLAKVAILGAGTLGATFANLVAWSGAATDVAIIDLIPGLAESIAMDLQHARPMAHSNTHFRGSTDYAALAGANVVVIAPTVAGTAHSASLVPLLGEIQMAADAIAAHAPDAVLIFAGSPSEVLTSELQRVGNFVPERVLGIGATVASARLVAALAATANTSPSAIEAVAMGAEGSYICPLSTARVRGRLLRDVLTAAQVDAALAAAADAPALMRSLRPSQPASAAPAYAALELLDAVRGARPGPVSVSVMVESCYNIDSVVVGVTARLNLNGLASVIEMPLVPDELAAIRYAADGVRRRTKELFELLAE